MYRWSSNFTNSTSTSRTQDNLNSLYAPPRVTYPPGAMVFSKLIASIALLLAFSCSAVLAADPAPSENLRRLSYIPAKCCTRSQTCCYKYFVCGELCKKVTCVDEKICVLKKDHRCLKHITVRVCEIRCYAKYCPSSTVTRSVSGSNRSTRPPSTTFPRPTKRRPRHTGCTECCRSYGLLFRYLRAVRAQ